MVVLVCGVQTEPPVKLLIDALTRAEVLFAVLNQQELADDVRLRWRLTNSGITGKLKVKSDVFDLHEVAGVYQRFMSVEHMPAAANRPEIISKTRSILHALMELFDILPARIINHRRAMLSNNSKPFQSLLIRKCGFSIPETLVTNIPGDAAGFIKKNHPVIYKSISSVRSIVKTADPADRQRIGKTRFLPTQFQQQVSGLNVRVHVVGEKVFASRIITKAIDYRYAHSDNEEIELQPFELSKDLAEKCVSLTRKLNLLFAGIDLIIGKSKTYCLEVNTSPAYSFYQQYTGQPIAEAIAALLSRKREKPDIQ